MQRRLSSSNLTEIRQIHSSTPTTRFVNARSVACLLGVSRRTVDNLLRRGLPHLRLSPRKNLYDPDAVVAWVRREFGVRRNGPLKPTNSSPSHR